MNPQDAQDAKVKADMQRFGRLCDSQLPFGWGFVFLAFPFGDGGRMNYVSNADRPDVVRAMYEFIDATRDQWAAHEPPLGAAAEDEALGRARQRAAQTEAELAFCMRACAKAIHRLERAGLKKDAQQIRAELATFGIEVQIMPDPTDQNN